MKRGAHLLIAAMLVLAPALFGSKGNTYASDTMNAPTAKQLIPLRNEAWGGFYWFSNGRGGPYGKAHDQDQRATVFSNPSQTLDVRGGWHDAGDYGKYSVNTAHSVSLLLLTALHAEEVLPEKIRPVVIYDKNLPDWQNLILHPLLWLLRMQSEEGGVYHKAATPEFAPMGAKPADDTVVKFVMPVSSTATAHFSAVMALATLALHDTSYAKGFSEAGDLADKWLSKNTSLAMPNEKYGKHSYGGAYHDTDDSDERLFAAAARAVLSARSEHVRRSVDWLLSRKIMISQKGHALSWREVDVQAAWTLKLGEKLMSPSQKKALDEVLQSFDNHYQGKFDGSSLNIAHGDKDQFQWGFNGHLAAVGWHNLMVEKLIKPSGQTPFGLAQLNWFLGKNPLKRQFVTGAQNGRIKAPHFRPWSSGAVDLPQGLLVGGPNSGPHYGDPILEKLQSAPPAQRHGDDVKSYATNEVAINWQAAWAAYLALAAAAVK